MGHLLRTVLAGPRDRTTGLPQYVDVLGQVSAGGPGTWSFRCVSDKGREGETVGRAWQLRRGFGATEAGLIIVGVSLALADRAGAAGEQSKALIRRRRLDPAQDVVVIPDLVQACRPVHELPLALVVSSDDDVSGMLLEVAATGWSVSAGSLGRP